MFQMQRKSHPSSDVCYSTIRNTFNEYSCFYTTISSCSCFFWCEHACLNKKDNKSRVGEAAPGRQYLDFSPFTRMVSWLLFEKKKLDLRLFCSIVLSEWVWIRSLYRCMDWFSMVGRGKCSTESCNIGRDPKLTCRLRECVSQHYQNQVFSYLDHRESVMQTLVGYSMHSWEW